RREKYQTENAGCAKPIVALQAWSGGWLWPRAQTHVKALQLAWREDNRNPLRQPLRNCLPRFFGVANAAHRSEGIVFAATRGKAVHEIHNGINDDPGEVAAQRPDEHFAHIRLARTAHAQRAGEREHHDYPAQHLE